jgi:2'-5' RNA ligase
VSEGEGPGGGRRVDGPAERVRLFVALELPDDAREHLVKWRRRLPDGGRGLRPIDSENLHATLCFLGWRSSEEIGAIRAACFVAGSRPAPELRLGEGIWLPPRRPRVLAVALRDESGALVGLQAVLSDALARGGWYEPEKRPYLGHVTVARAARGFRQPRAALPPSPGLAFSASNVTLYRSRLLRSGARYEPLARVQLSTA